jgi:hypothetical protein
MIDMAHANMEAFFGLARQLTTAKAPSDILELWTAHARKQFETLTEQIKELTALGQKTAAESGAVCAQRQPGIQESLLNGRISLVSAV